MLLQFPDENGNLTNYNTGKWPKANYFFPHELVFDGKYLTKKAWLFVVEQEYLQEKYLLYS